MKYKVIKLNFENYVHFADGMLDTSRNSFDADTFFSALCIESIKFDNQTFDNFIKLVKNKNLIFSNAFPYDNEIYYLPKPILQIKKDVNSVDSMLKKAFKNLKYIPLDEFDNYLSGNFNPLDNKYSSEFGVYNTKVSVSIKGEDQSRPYRVGGFKFKDNCGLYIVVGYKDDSFLQILDEIIKSLSYSGIGGERSSGYGRFLYNFIDVPVKLNELLNTKSKWYMTLSNCLPREDELSEVIENSKFLLKKRSGFVSSNSCDTPKRKKDIYLFNAGSCFTKQFSGDVYDVSCNAISHPVYRYALPLFVGVNYE